MRHHAKVHRWAKAHGIDVQALADGLHDAVNAGIDAMMDVLFEAADHVDEIVRDARAAGACAPGSSPAAWSDTE